MLKNHLAQLEAVNRRLWITVLTLAICLAVMAIAIVRASDTRRIYLPPQLRVGQVIDGKAVPEAVVYQFAVSIFQQLNRWPNDGASDYVANIDTLRHYLTPAYRSELVRDVDARRAGRAGVSELSGRERGLSLPQGTVFDNASVSQGDNGAWVVRVALDVVETYDGVTVKSVRVRYPIRVVDYGVDWEKNPWGLALDGFAAPGPERVAEGT